MNEPQALPSTALWPRFEVELANGKTLIHFNPRTVAIIERESGLSSKDFAEKMKLGERAPLADVGMRMLLGAMKSVHPTMTEELLGERIAPYAFGKIFSGVAEAWGEATKMMWGEVEEASAADPTKPGAASGSPTSALGQESKSA